MATSGAGSNWANGFVDSMFNSAFAGRLDRRALQSITKDQLSSGLDPHTVHPQKLNPVISESTIKTDLYRIGSSSSNQPVSITRFSSERLLTVLEMDNSASGPGNVRIPGTGGRGRGRGRGRGSGAVTGAGAGGAGGGMRRSHSTAFDDITGDEEDNEAKRRRLQAAAAAAAQMQQQEEEDEMFGAAAAPTPLVTSDMYPVLQSLFNEFWGLRLDSGTGVAAAFFAKISAANCLDYGLTSFADVSSSMPVIKERLDKKKYRKAEDFRLDFKRMFKNITTYYPAEHPAVPKAVELDALFDKKWQDVRLKLYGVP